MTDCSVLFGVPIDGCTMAQTLGSIGEFILNGRAQQRTHHITTVNVDFLVNAISEPDVMRLLQHADLNLADGMPLLWASALFGTPLPERVAGADLVPRLAGESAAHGWRVHLFGGAPGVAQRARQRMLETHPEARITTDSGPARVDVNEPDPAVVDAIRAVDADVLCVALGNPKQERFIATYRQHLECPVMIGIGGSLDMLIGDKQRAPEWAQRTGAEWLFRAAQEPRRLGRRYAHDVAVFGPQLVSYARGIRNYRHAHSLTARRDSSHQLGVTVATDDLHPLRSGPMQVGLAGVAGVDVDLDGVGGLTPRAHAELIALIRSAALLGIPVTLRHVSEPLRACFEAYRTWGLLAEILTKS